MRQSSTSIRMPGQADTHALAKWREKAADVVEEKRQKKEQHHQVVRLGLRQAAELMADRRLPMRRGSAQLSHRSVASGHSVGLADSETTSHPPSPGRRRESIAPGGGGGGGGGGKPMVAAEDEAPRQYRLHPIRVRMQTRKKEELRIHTDRVVHLGALGLLATCESNERGATLWDANDLQAVGRLQHPSQVLDVVHARGPSLIVGAGIASGIVCWDESLLFEQQRIHSLEPVLSLAWHAGSGRLFGGDAHGVIRRWELRGCTEVGAHNPMRAHTDFVNALLCLDDGRAELLVSASSDRSVRQWHTETGREVRALRHHGAAVHSLAQLTGHRLLVSAARERDIYLWSPYDHTRPVPLKGLPHEAPVVFVTDVGRSSPELISADAEGVVKVWDVRSNYGPVQTIRPLPRAVPQHTHEPFYTCAYSRERSSLFCASSVEWRVHRPLEHQGRSASGPIGAVAFNHATCELLLASDAGVSVWSLGTGQSIVAMPSLGHTEVVAMLFDPDDTHLLTAHADGGVRLWAYSVARAHERLHLIAQLAQLDAEAAHLLVVPQPSRRRRFGVLVATAAAGSAVKLLSLMRGSPLEQPRPLEMFTPLCAGPRELCVSEAKGLVAIFGADRPRALELWDTGGERVKLRTVLKLPHGIVSAAFADSISTLLLLTADAALCLFELPRVSWTMRMRIDPGLPRRAPRLLWDEDESMLLCCAPSSADAPASLTLMDVAGSVKAEVDEDEAAARAGAEAAAGQGWLPELDQPGRAAAPRAPNAPRAGGGGAGGGRRASGRRPSEAGLRRARALTSAHSGRARAAPTAALRQHVEGRPSCVYASAPMHELGEVEVSAEWEGATERADDALTVWRLLGQDTVCLGFYSAEVHVRTLDGRLYGRLGYGGGMLGSWTAPPVATSGALVAQLGAQGGGASSPHGGSRRASHRRARATQQAALVADEDVAGMSEHLLALRHLIGNDMANPLAAADQHLAIAALDARLEPAPPQQSYFHTPPARAPALPKPKAKPKAKRSKADGPGAERGPALATSPPGQLPPVARGGRAGAEAADKPPTPVFGRERRRALGLAAPHAAPTSRGAAGSAAAEPDAGSGTGASATALPPLQPSVKLDRRVSLSNHNPATNPRLRRNWTQGQGQGEGELESRVPGVSGAISEGP